MEGPTLKQFMGGRPLETLSALSIAIQLADALAVAHASGIVHRDLKPANIIVGPAGQARILDFGLAKMLVPDAAEPGGTPPSRTDDPLTEVGVPYGSMGYSSPEQASGQAADHRSDVFSLGVVLYEMVAGTAPFRGASRGRGAERSDQRLPAADHRSQPAGPSGPSADTGPGDGEAAA